MTNAFRTPGLRMQQSPHRALIDSAALFVYLAVVHGWAIGLGPSGRDYANFAGEGKLSQAAALLVRRVAAAFGDSAYLYLLLNFVLLYALCLTIYWIHRIIQPDTRVWLGTLAAACFMAHPLKADAVLNLTGVVDLVPALLALITVLLYVAHIRRHSHLILVGIIIAYSAAAAFPENRMLFAALLAVEIVVAARDGREWLVRAVAIMAIGTFFAVQGPWTVPTFNPAIAWTPLYFMVYPLGFLPENAIAFHQTPWLAWACVVAVVASVVIVLWQARSPVAIACVLAAVLYRTTPASGHVDPVHLIGGGAMMAPLALFFIGLSAIFDRVMSHRKWQRGVVSFTTLLAAVLFGMQIYGIGAWRRAQEYVDTTRITVQSMRAGNTPITIMPDYRYFRGAPILLSDSLRYDTPFSIGVAVEPMLPLDYAPPGERDVVLLEVDGQKAIVEVSGRDALGAIPWPYSLAVEGNVQRGTKGDALAQTVSHDRLVVSVRRHEGTFNGPMTPLHRFPRDP